MSALEYLSQIILRFRYPVSLPEDIAKALGVDLANTITFNEIVDQLSSPCCSPKRLTRFMPRNEAENAFNTACKCERFHQNTHCSYYFTEGWIEFILQFDSEARLRRIYVHHKNSLSQKGIEIRLN